jgi:hypothetical protein
VGAVLIDLGMIEETELVDVEAVPDGSAVLTWQTADGQTFTLALPAEATWEVGGESGSWVVTLTFDGPASVSLEVEGPSELEWADHAGGGVRLH